MKGKIVACVAVNGKYDNAMSVVPKFNKWRSRGGETGSNKFWKFCERPSTSAVSIWVWSIWRQMKLFMQVLQVGVHVQTFTPGQICSKGLSLFYWSDQNTWSFMNFIMVTSVTASFRQRPVSSHQTCCNSSRDILVFGAVSCRAFYFCADSLVIPYAPLNDWQFPILRGLTAMVYDTIISMEISNPGPDFLTIFTEWKGFFHSANVYVLMSIMNIFPLDITTLLYASSCSCARPSNYKGQMGSTRCETPRLMTRNRIQTTVLRHELSFQEQKLSPPEQTRATTQLRANLTKTTRGAIYVAQ